MADPARLELLERVLESMEEGVLLTDEGGELQFWNRAAERLIGFGDGAPGTNVFLSDQATPCPADDLPWVRATREAIDGVELFLRPPERPNGLWVRAQGQPVVDGDGRSRGGVVVLSDITDTRDDDLAQLTLGFAHDIANLIGVVLTISHSLLLSLPAESEETSMVQDLLEVARRATRLTENMRRWPRRTPNPPRVNLSAVIDERYKLLHRLAGSRVELHLELAPAPLPVAMEPSRIGRILVNLVKNSCDACPSGGQITISARAVSSPRGDEVELAVHDNGPGIEPAVRARLFEPFFSTKRQAGSGLGLPTVARIVRLAGGRIEVDSEPDIGTTVLIRLPHAGDQPG